MIKICAGITLYNPSNEDIDNLIYYSKFFDVVFVYNNSEGDNLSNYELCNSIVVISSGNNDGLGIACDVLCKEAKKNGFEFIMLFDQDSRMSTPSLKNMLKFVSARPKLGTVYAPRIDYRKNEKYELTCNYEFVKWCITSGSVICLADYDFTVSFDNKYFIDRLDKDFCEQIIRAGKKIVQLNRSVLIQTLGEKEKNGFLGHKPFRHYYIARNRLYFNKKFKLSFFVSLLQTIKHMILILCFESQKCIKIKYMFLGINDFVKGKMGKKEFS